MHDWLILVGLLYLSIGSTTGFDVQLRYYKPEISSLKCDMLPYRSVYYHSACYFAVDSALSYSAAVAQCERIFAGAALERVVPSEVWSTLFLDKSQFHSGNAGASRDKKALCAHYFGAKVDTLSAIVKCSGDKKVIAKTSLDGVVNASSVRSVLFGPIVVEDKRECESLCRCASGKKKTECDCGPFACLSLPSSISCEGFAFEAGRGHCALLGETAAGCASPNNVYTFEVSPAISIPSKDDPDPTPDVPVIPETKKCGQITVDSRVKCRADGYTCPDNFLPYLVCDIYGQLSYTGGQRIFKRQKTWIVSYSTGEYSFSESVAKNISCLPAGTHTYDQCSWNVPRLGNALILDNSYGCIDGYTWNYAKTSTGAPFSDVPVCKHEGWSNNWGRLNAPITEMWCRPDWKSDFPKCGQITLGDKVKCTEKGYTCPEGSIPYLACLIDNLWSFTGGKFVYKSGNKWKVEYSTGTWQFEERYGFNVSCRAIAKHSHSICSKSIPRLGNALIKKDKYGCIKGFEWNYAKTKDGEAFHDIPECSAEGWTAGGDLLDGPINEMWCKPLAEQNSKCGAIHLDEKVECRKNGYVCADKYLPYLACYIDSQWSFTGGSRIHKEGSQWVVSYSSGHYKFNEDDAHNITCIYAGSPSKAACGDNVPRYGNAYLAGDTFTCITGYSWNYAKTVNEPRFKGIPKCDKNGWTVDGKKLASPIAEMWCKPL